MPPPIPDRLRLLQRHLPALAVAFAGLLALRAVLLLQGSGGGLSPWLLAADLAAAAFVVLAAPWLTRSLPARLAAAIAGGFAYYAAGEHLYAHASLFRLAHLGQAFNADFLAASMLSPDTLFLPLYAAIAYLCLAALSRTPAAACAGRGRVRAMLVLLVAYYLAVPTPTLPANNVLLSALVQIPGAGWRSVPREAEPNLLAGDNAVDPAFFLRDDDGRATGRPDVLLILIESLSAAYLPSVARHHGLAPEIALPELDALLDRHGFTVYRNVLALQRQTNRGTYPLLCGDYPKIVTAVPKMTVAASGDQSLDCVPRLLREAGYRTAYIQAAPLSYMNKNKFMPQAGFEQMLGRETFVKRGLPANGWGPEDGDFFAVAGDELRRLDAGRGPWFAALLNVGTHHPYRAVQDAGLRTVRQQAFSDMAAALGDLLDGLAAQGMLADTWVFLTSDEAGGFRELGDRELALANNFGMLAVRPPGRMSAAGLANRDAIVAQIDVPVTILDLLGLSDRGNMIGRSLLADRPLQTRGLMFGDTYRARSYFLYEDGRLTDCDETLVRCRQWRFDPDRLFGSLQPDPADPPLTLGERTALAADASLIRDLGIATAEEYRLAPGPITADRAYRGGQHLRVSRGDSLTLHLKGRVTTATPPAGGGHLRVVLREARSGEDVIASRRLRVDGERIEHRLTVTVRQDRAAVSVEVHWAPDRAGDGVVLQELTLSLQEPG